jgi:hypothetical protein
MSLTLQVLQASGWMTVGDRVDDNDEDCSAAKTDSSSDVM